MLLLLILSVAVLIPMRGGPLRVTERLPSLNHTLSILRENCLPPATCYGHPVTLLAWLPVNLSVREIL